jgi:hypothetical protein
MKKKNPYLGLSVEQLIKELDIAIKELKKDLRAGIKRKAAPSTDKQHAKVDIAAACKKFEKKYGL